MAVKRYLVWSCLLVCGSTLVCADDLPIDEEPFPGEDYLLLSLSEDQIDEIDSRRRFTLSNPQLKELRTLVPGFPRKIGVASPFVDQIPNSRWSMWPDQISGVWYRKGRVAIPRHSLDGVAGHREFSTTLSDSDAVLVGIRGEYWIGSRKADREKLIKCLDLLAIKEPPGAEFGVFVLRPPLLEDDTEEDAVRSAVDDLVNLCHERGLGVRIGG